MQSLKQIFREQEKLRHIYQTVKAAIFTPWFTFIPDDIYSPGSERMFMQLNLGNVPEQEMAVDHLKKAGTYMAYIMPQSIKSLLQDHFERPEISHSATSIIENLVQRNKESDLNKVYIYVNKNYLEIFIFKRNIFTYYNSFPFRTAEDFIYYIMLVYNQLKLDTEDDPLIFLGELEKQSTLFNIAYKYIRNIRFGSRPGTHEYGEGFDGVPPHYYYNIFSI